jgi:hypothetical protein
MSIRHRSEYFNRFVYRSPRLECPSGFTENTAGECIETVPKELVCPSGFTETATGECQRVVARELVCPEGTQLNTATGRCEVRLQTA